ncbi:hypothetical protein [Mycobacteroides chelonae]|uniref:hypothetical protein n=1 Tax=Mycobacteroides TaxID=670516 RepID=UPI0008A890E8|nr:hypothetical protein [Mycobacteroides chelonae]AYM40718.1 hypothetical protein DYE20_03330 [[Mycobacterium] chelonae subsp. gwanakae]OHU16294.1 hypothetical protein BKG75_14960 [Mycobacteroides chelonae]
MSTDQDIQTIKNFRSAATSGGDGFVTFSHAAWDSWDKAITNFLGEVKKAEEKIKDLKGIGQVPNYTSAEKYRTLLNETAPNEIEASIKKYREYLEELQGAIKATYDSLNSLDQS